MPTTTASAQPFAGPRDRGPDAATRLLEWLGALDPAVRNLSLGLLLAGLVVAAVSVSIGLLLVSAGPAVLAWAKPDAVSRHHHLREWQLAEADLERRFRAGQLDDDAYRRRRSLLRETAPV